MSRPLFAAAHVVHESFVYFLDEPQAQRHPAADTVKPVFQGRDVVCDFDGIRGLGGITIGLGFEQEQLVQPRDGSFDLARQHGLASNERANQEVRIGQHAADAGQFAKRPVSGRQALHEV
jgi:hypothetical protein